MTGAPDTRVDTGEGEAGGDRVYAFRNSYIVWETLERNFS